MARDPGGVPVVRLFTMIGRVNIRTSSRARGVRKSFPDHPHPVPVRPVLILMDPQGRKYPVALEESMVRVRGLGTFEAAKEEGFLL